MQLFQISAKSAVSLEVLTGDKVRIVNAEGGQVVDTWAFNFSDFSEYLSMEHSRGAMYRLLFRTGDTLVSNLYQPMLTITQDTSPGYHDTLHAACSPGSNAFFGASENYPNCQDNLKKQIKKYDENLQTIPCPWNLFEHALVDSKMQLSDARSGAMPGDYIELRAEMDMILVCSACPSRVGLISGDKPCGAAIEYYRVNEPD